MRVLLTVDVEAHRVVDEISGSKHDSLGCILSAFEQHGIRGTFFVDLCEVNTWGEGFMQRVCERVLTDGHELGLHVHPHHSSGDAKRWLLSQYSPDEQNSILGAAIDKYRQYVGTLPAAFRAGGFGLDDSTIDFLRLAGVKVDSSYMWGWPGCLITPPTRGLPVPYRGVTELPMTPMVALGTERWPLRIAPLDFNWQPLFVLRSALKMLREASAPCAVLLLHSSSMYLRIGARRFMYRRAHERKLNKLLGFLVARGFQTTTVQEAAAELSPVREVRTDVVYVVRGAPTQYAILIFQSIVGFGISRRFRIFLLGNILLLGLALIVAFRLTGT